MNCPAMMNIETSVENDIRFTVTKPFCRIMRGFAPLEVALRGTCYELFSQSPDAKRVSANGTGKPNKISTHEAIMLNENPSMADGEDNRESGDCMKES